MKKRYILYVNVTNMPQSHMTAYMEGLVDNLKTCGVVDESDKIAALGVYVGDTRLELISED